VPADCYLFYFSLDFIFFRRIIRLCLYERKKTKTADVLQLVESYRNDEGQPRQRIVLSLGSIDIASDIRQ
jgi:hypothetical protein